MKYMIANFKKIGGFYNESNFAHERIFYVSS